MAPTPRIIVFDVNETLLDVGALAPHFQRAFGDGDLFREWFSTLLLYSEVATLAGHVDLRQPLAKNLGLVQ